MGSPRRDVSHDLAPPSIAPQQSRGPRPLPLFVELLRQVAARDPELGQKALEGLRRYQVAPPPPPRRNRPVVHSVHGTSLRDCGGSGPAVVLVPSLINPPTILDLDPACSLADALAVQHRVLLLDWGVAAERKDLSLGGHVAHRLVPLIEAAGPVTLIGYCLGGTLALAAASGNSQVEAVVTLASPYRFAAYDDGARKQLLRLWKTSEAAAEQLGFLPMEVLQAAFWQIDPGRLMAKFARFVDADPTLPEAQRFIAMEEWANSGEPLPLPAARQMVEQLFGADVALAPLPTCPMLHVTAAGDRIVPAATAAAGQQISSPSGHVGMIVGRDAPRTLHAPLLSWLEGAARGR
ncbi:alpha/beta fold hydrolase [Sphingomonas glaciei]|uniref:Alpha/beta fold hydrolase n=1 Tax=Sphingomonas glaciei TaxID=2938948 RepID=A0ABY5MVX8_9SPHN|nr:alpha/beta fold hydrolase [Sphingomonas glaciei]UUR08408.1 alpha/beta fold hydrolase [Sphingomonas glaciei]